MGLKWTVFDPGSFFRRVRCTSYFGKRLHCFCPVPSFFCGLYPKIPYGVLFHNARCEAVFDQKWSHKCFDWFHSPMFSLISRNRRSDVALCSSSPHPSQTSCRRKTPSRIPSKRSDRPYRSASRLVRNKQSMALQLLRSCVLLLDKVGDV